MSALQQLLRIVRWSGLRRLPLKDPPFIRQAEASECGLACLAMILVYHGQRVNLRYLRDRFGFSLRGAPLSSLVQVARELGFTTKALRTSVDQLGAVRTPSILFWNFDHYVVLARVEPQHLVIQDPARGKRKIPIDEAMRLFSGVALELAWSPTAGQLKAPPDLNIRHFFLGINGLWKATGLIVLLMLAGQLALVVIPLFSKGLIDKIVGDGVSELLSYLIAAWVVALLLQVAVDAIRDKFSLVVYSTYSLRTREALFRHLLALPMRFFERRPVADVNQRFQSLDDMLQVLTEGSATAFLDGAFCVLGIAFVFFHSATLGFITLLTSAVLALVIVRTAPLQLAYRDQIIEASGNEVGVRWASIQCVQTLKLLGAERKRLEQYRDAATEVTTTRVGWGTLNVRLSALRAAIQGTCQLSSLTLGAYFVATGAMSLGSLFALQTYQHLLLTRFQSGLMSWSRIRSCAVDVGRVSDIILEQPEFDARMQEPADVGFRGSLKLINAHYGYARNDPEVLIDINLHVHIGECIAIVGDSGCGKTTLLKVMTGLLPPTRGRVVVDGRDLVGAYARDFRSRIGVVMQQDQLLPGSILENVSFPDAHPDEERVYAALHEAHVDRDIHALPMGLRTRVGDMGSVLSAGQRQRLLLARALYRRPAVLFLDEVTAALDPQTERNVVDTLGGLKNTRVIVTHRPEILRIADRIATLTNGRLVWHERTPPETPTLAAQRRDSLAPTSTHVRRQQPT